MKKSPPFQKKRRNRTICLPFSEEEYLRIIHDAMMFRTALDAQIARSPELFPRQIVQGYRLKEITHSKKLSVPIRRILVDGVSYTIRPSYLLPYMTGLTDDVETALFFRKFNVPYWALSYGFGRNPMYWYRQEQALGRNSLVGTTIAHPDALPDHILVDEKHTTLLGKKVYVTATAAKGCLLGAAVAEHADEATFTQAYGTFKTEAQQLQPDYAPTTVNTDGWQATHNALKALFPTLIVIRCFLHIYIKIRDRTTKAFRERVQEMMTKLWACYQADAPRSFAQRIRRLHEWAQRQSLPDVLCKPLELVRQNLSAFTGAYAYPGAYRTSNMLDRLMQRMDRRLFAMQYFHGTRESAEQHMRAWALLLNFTPSNPVTVKAHQGRQSPAERLNQSRYHDNWLQNLFISASLGGYREAPLNPL
jgi:hypothetical protein